MSLFSLLFVFSSSSLCLGRLWAQFCPVLCWHQFKIFLAHLNLLDIPQPWSLGALWLWMFHEDAILFIACCAWFLQTFLRSFSRHSLRCCSSKKFSPLQQLLNLKTSATLTLRTTFCTSDSDTCPNRRKHTNQACMGSPACASITQSAFPWRKGFFLAELLQNIEETTCNIFACPTAKNVKLISRK